MPPRAEAARSQGMSPPSRGVKRGRALAREVSDVKLPAPTKRQRGAAAADIVPSGCADAALEATQLQAPKQKVPAAAAKAAAASAAAEAAKKAEFVALMDRRGVPPSAHERLAPLLRRWGPARTSQVLGLWTFLGDGATRPVSAASLQIWGPGGAGKTVILKDFLTSTGIRHVHLRCEMVATMGDLFNRLAEELRRAAVAASKDPGRAATGDLPRELQQRAIAVGRQLRGLDRLEAAVRAPLEYLGRCSSGGATGSGPSKVVVVLDQVQALPRLGEGAVELLTSLPEVLQRGDQLTIVTVGRMPLSSLGLLEARNPPAVAFEPYTSAEAERILLEKLSKQAETLSAPPAIDLSLLCSSGLMKFAAPFVGHDVGELFQVGKRILESQLKAEPGVAELQALQDKVDEIIEKRMNFCDLRKLLPPGEVAEDCAAAAAKISMLVTTKAEKRLLLAAYLATRISNQDDWQLFLPTGRRTLRKRGPVMRTRADDDQPPAARVPQPVILARLVSIYCRLARQPQLLSALIYEHLRKLSELGLLNLMGESGGLDKDIKVMCHADLPLARACAGDLSIDLAEYLCTH